MVEKFRVGYEHAGGTRESGAGSDLSLGGVFIETQAMLPVGALLSVEIESGTTRVSLDARILSRRPSTPDRPAGIAVGFIDLPNDAAASLQFIMGRTSKRPGTMLGLGEAEDDIPAYKSERRLPVPGKPLSKPPELMPSAPPLARPVTPVMPQQPVQAPAPFVPLQPPPPIFQPFAHPSHPPAHPSGHPPGPASWGPPPGAPSWLASSPPLGPASAPGNRGIATALIVGGVVLLLVLIAVAIGLIRASLG